MCAERRVEVLQHRRLLQPLRQEEREHRGLVYRVDAADPEKLLPCLLEDADDGGKTGCLMKCEVGAPQESADLGRFTRQRESAGFLIALVEPATLRSGRSVPALGKVDA